MNAELRKDPDTEGPLFYRDPMQGTSYIETEMSMTPYNRNCPLLCPHTHTHITTTQPTQKTKGKLDTPHTVAKSEKIRQAGVIKALLGSRQGLPGSMLGENGLYPRPILVFKTVLGAQG